MKASTVLQPIVLDQHAQLPLLLQQLLRVTAGKLHLQQSGLCGVGWPGRDCVAPVEAVRQCAGSECAKNCCKWPSPAWTCTLPPQLHVLRPKCPPPPRLVKGKGPALGFEGHCATRPEDTGKSMYRNLTEQQSGWPGTTISVVRCRHNGDDTVARCSKFCFV